LAAHRQYGLFTAPCSGWWCNGFGQIELEKIDPIIGLSRLRKMGWMTCALLIKGGTFNPERPLWVESGH
jgi:hypothetical protein